MSITTRGWGTHGTISTWGWGGWYILPPAPPKPQPLPPWECTRIRLLETATNKMLANTLKDGVPKSCQLAPIKYYQETIYELCRRISSLEIHLMSIVGDGTELYKEIERLGLVIEPLSVLDCLVMGDGQDPTRKKN